MNEIKTLGHWDMLGSQLTIYGTIGEPLFLAKEIAACIEHSKADVMIANIDNDEKVKVKNVYVDGRTGGNGIWFLTEYGLYEVLMQSRKPIAKEFKKKVKEVLKELRRTGKYEVPKDDSQARSTGFGTLDGVPVLTTAEAAERFHVTTKAIRVVIRDYASRDFKDGEDYVFGAKFTAKYKKQNPGRRVSRTYFIFSSGIAKLEARFRQTVGFDGNVPALEKPEHLPAPVKDKAPAVADGDDLTRIWTQVEALCGLLDTLEKQNSREKRLNARLVKTATKLFIAVQARALKTIR